MRSPSIPSGSAHRDGYTSRPGGPIRRCDGRGRRDADSGSREREHPTDRVGLALGGATFKLKFGHRGGNHPVRDQRSRKIAITSQNHGYAVDAGSLPDAVEVTHINLNDGTVEGLAHRTRPLFSVQYHPEASPGPHDAAYLFARFREMVARHRAGEAVTGAEVAGGAAEARG